MLDAISMFSAIVIVIGGIFSIFFLIAYAIWRIENRKAIYYLKWMDKNGVEGIKWVTIKNEDGRSYRYPTEVLIKTPKGECILRPIGVLTRSSAIIFNAKRKIILVDGLTHRVHSDLEDSHIEDDTLSHAIFSKKINKSLEDIIAMENM